MPGDGPDCMLGKPWVSVMTSMCSGCGGHACHMAQAASEGLSPHACMHGARWQLEHAGHSPKLPKQGRK